MGGPQSAEHSSPANCNTRRFRSHWHLSRHTANLVSYTWDHLYLIQCNWCIVTRIMYLFFCWRRLFFSRRFRSHWYVSRHTVDFVSYKWDHVHMIYWMYDILNMIYCYSCYVFFYVGDACFFRDASDLIGTLVDAPQTSLWGGYGQ